MNKFLKVFGIVVALVTMCSVCVAAGVQLERIDAYLNHGLNVVKDGQVLILKDANGKKLTPITYNDSTYLPVRAIANALGVQVDWDQETQSVLLGGSKVPAHLKPVQQSTTSVNYGTPHYTESDVEMMAKVMYCEARGIASKKEIACIGWVILNRVDKTDGYDFNKVNTTKDVILQKNQFAYDPSAPMVTDEGIDLKELARSVLNIWSAEKNGISVTGRVLPHDFMWYHGDGKHNYFRNEYQTKSYWNYSLPNPYEN